MPYASNADLQERLGPAVCVQLTDDAGSGTADEDKVTAARVEAEGEVNSYLGRRYAVPIDVMLHDEIAAILRSVTLDLAVHKLHGRRPPVPEDIRRRREAAVRWLQSVASGTAVLPAASELEGNSAMGVTGEVLGAKRVMSRRELEGL